MASKKPKYPCSTPGCNNGASKDRTCEQCKSYGKALVNEAFKTNDYPEYERETTPEIDFNES